MAGTGGEVERLVRLAMDPPALVLVEGEAGVGKSRLVADVAAHPALDGRPVVLGRCRGAGPLELEPVVDGLRQLPGLPPGLPPVAGALAPLVPELAGYLPPPPPITSRHVRFRALEAVLGALGPALCILEDLHRADRETARFLRFLAAGLPAGVALVVTYRPEDLPSAASPVDGLLAALPAGAAGAHLRLQPLDVAGVADLIGALRGTGPAEPRLAAAVHRRTGGLPFAVEQVVATGAPENGPVPVAVVDAVLARVRLLDRAARRVAEAAAVAGGPAAPEALVRIAGLAPAAGTAALECALRAAVLVEHDPGQVGCRHPLAAEALAAALTGPERARLEQRAMAELRGRPPRPGCDGRRPPGLGRAAAPCAVPRRADGAAAAKLLSDALARPGLQGARRASLAEALASAALRSAGTWQRDAIDALAGVLDGSGLPVPAAGRVRQALGALQVWSGDAGTGWDTVHRSLGDLRDQPLDSAVAMAELAAGPRLGLGLDARLAWLDRAAGIAGALADPVVELRLLGARARVLLHAGDPRAWAAVRRLPARSVAPGERRLLAWTRLNLAWGCVYVGADRRARSLLADAATERDPRHDRFGAICDALDLQLRFLAGDWAGLDAGNPAEVGTAAVTALQIRGLRSLAAGDLAEASEALGECAERAERSGMARSLAVAAAGLARVDLARGDPGAAVRRTGQAVESLTAGATWVWASEVVGAALESAVAAGRVDEAESLGRAFAAGVRDRDAPLAAAVVAANRGILAEASGDPARAAAAYRRAAHAFGRMPRPYDAARASAAAGRCSLGAGLHVAAAVDLTDALTRFAALGATLDAAGVGPLLEACDQPPAPPPIRRGRRPYGPRLSPREVQVVDLAACGLTNTEIADELGISPRTVENHVAAGLRKLGMPSKRALVGRAPGPI